MWLLAAAMLLAACGGGSAPAVPAGPDGTPDPVLVQGRAIYEDRCASCHGTSGGGTRRGPGYRNGQLAEDYPDIADAVDIVRDGRDRMPGFSRVLSEAEMVAVVRYIREVL